MFTISYQVKQLYLLMLPLNLQLFQIKLAQNRSFLHLLHSKIDSKRISMERLSAAEVKKNYVKLKHQSKMIISAFRLQQCCLLLLTCIALRRPKNCEKTPENAHPSGTTTKFIEPKFIFRLI